MARIKINSTGTQVKINSTGTTVLINRPPAIMQTFGSDADNVFNTGTIVNDKYISSLGVESVAAGWKLVKIPISGQTDVWLKGFGGRPSGSPSMFYRFWDGSVMEYGGFNDYEVIHLEIPEGATELAFTLKQSGEIDDVYINGFVSFTDPNDRIYAGEFEALPASEITATVCAHRYGAACAVVQNTDTLNTNSWTAAELYGFKRNIQLTAFVNPYDGGQTPYAYVEDVGRIKFDLYMPTDRWKNPTSGVIEIIPDYNATAWTSAGVTAFGVALGAAKAERYPNHGQEMYDLTSGALGWDITNGVAGANNGNEFYGMMDAVESLFDISIGKKIAAFSYRNGQLGCAKLALTRFLGGRNSDYPLDDLGDAKTNYGDNNGLPDAATNRVDRISSASSSRNWDMWHDSPLVGTEAEVLDYIEAELLKTIANGGFFNDFMHWHNASGDLTYIDDFFQLLNDTIGVNFVWRCSYGEAMQYLFLREMIAGVSAYEVDGMVNIVVQKTNPFTGSTSGISEVLPYDVMNQPISVNIDLAGTSLAGKDIVANVGSIRHVAGDQYIIQIPIGTRGEGFTAVQLSEGTANYLNFDLPVITSASIVGSTIEVVTDIPTKATLFRATASAAESTSVIHGRRTTLSTTHIFDISTHPTLDFRVGVISRTGQSTLSALIA